MKNTIDLLTACFDRKISVAEIPYLRGNMIRLAGDNSLFHNHDAEGFRYAYPLVQYKRIDGRAALVGLNQGAEALQQLLGEFREFRFMLGNRPADMGGLTIRTERFRVGCDGEGTLYTLSRWLPLNGENYRTWQQTESLAERVAMLERILIANILSFAKGVGIFFECPVECRLVQLEPEGLVTYKEVELMSFSARFRCNVSLPDQIGLGKAASVGFGVVKRMQVENEKSNTII